MTRHGELRLLPTRLALLREAVERHRPDLRHRLETLGVEALTETERDALREAVAQELLASGLNEDNEPNSRGLELEALVDDLGRL